MVETPEKETAPLNLEAHPWLLRGWDYPLLLAGLTVLLVGLAVLAAGVGPYKLSYGHIFSLVKRWVFGDTLNPAEATALAVGQYDADHPDLKDDGGRRRLWGLPGAEPWPERRARLELAAPASGPPGGGGPPVYLDQFSLYLF
jgi:hypothetical protein